MWKAHIPGAEVEEVLQRGPQQVHDQDIVVPLLAVPSYVGYAHTALHNRRRLRIIYNMMYSNRCSQ